MRQVFTKQMLKELKENPNKNKTRFLTKTVDIL